LAEAARVLGVSKGAVRQRVKRGTLRSDKGDDGRVYVYLDASLDVPTDASLDAGSDSLGSGKEDPRERLIAELRAEVEAWREESRRKDHIIAGLVERLPPQLEAPKGEESSPYEPRESPESAAEGTIRDTPFTEEEKPISRPWWRRVFGG
jgi:hypothetical protein